MTRLLSWLCLPALLLSCQSVEEYYEYPDPEGLSSGASSSSMASPESSSLYFLSSSSAWVEPASSSSEGLGLSSSCSSFALSSSLGSSSSPGRSSSSASSSFEQSSSSVLSADKLMIKTLQEAAEKFAREIAVSVKNDQNCVYAENAGSSPLTGSLECAEQTYRTVKVAAQVWMAENLNYVPAQGSSWCYGEDETCGGYGRLYDWTTAMGIHSYYLTKSWEKWVNPHQGLCPNGWHVPSDEDWKVLERAVGMPEIALDLWSGRSLVDNGTGDRLKAVSPLWRPNTGTDEFGLALLPAGRRSLAADAYAGVGYSAEFWTGTASSDDLAVMRYALSSQSNFTRTVHDKNEGRSLRCVKDP